MMKSNVNKVCEEYFKQNNIIITFCKMMHRFAVDIVEQGFNMILILLNWTDNKETKISCQNNVYL